MLLPLSLLLGLLPGARLLLPPGSIRLLATLW